MSTVPIIPESAPFSSEQRSWLNGFLAGILSRGAAGTVPSINSSASDKPKLLVLFGSQSGNAESYSKKLCKEANARGFQARVAGLESIQSADLQKESNVLVVTSTWGEGDMPDNAVSFWDSLNQNGSSPKLEGLKFSVLALGDMNYGDTFCLAGRKLDQRLEELGAQRIHPRVDCDVEYDELARSWSEGVFLSLLDPATSGGGATMAPAMVETEIETGYTRKNPFPAPLIECVALNARRSAKDTRHVAFSLEASGLVYETGDALGLYPENCPEVVANIIEAQQLDADAIVHLHNGGEAPLREALQKHYEVRSLIGKTPAAKVSPAEFVLSLRKLQPRLYSIASSLKAHPNEVHLCVSAVRYEKDGLKHKGVASTFLADRLAVGETAGVFIHTAKHFRVPTDGRTPIIMVGPGTGIAPFRAFLEERQLTGDTGNNWLFFGDQKRSCDFLYHDQILAWVKDGHLTRLDTAFSRDQAEKIYVQDRMLSAASELWSWLEQGACFYVCGDASRMAKDVDAALHTIIQQQGGKSEDDAAAYVNEMKKSKRYARDVY